MKLHLPQIQPLLRLIKRHKIDSEMLDRFPLMLIVTIPIHLHAALRAEVEMGRFDVGLEVWEL